MFRISFGRAKVNPGNVAATPGSINRWWHGLPWSCKKFSSLASRRALVALGVLLLLMSLLICIVFLLVLDIRLQLSTQAVASSYNDIVQIWRSPEDNETWVANLTTPLSGNIIPIPCHSHNDYWRKVPLFEALASGCTGVEADVWLNSVNGTDSGLLVGHSRRDLKPEKTLENLYINPLLAILDKQNPQQSPTQLTTGVYDLGPNTTLVLMIDFKEKSANVWSLLRASITPLREKGYLRHWNGTAIIPGPITIVATGDASFDLITVNNTYRDIFFDAPLDMLSNTDKYNLTNSYYTSVSMSKTIGKIWSGKLSSWQKTKIESQITMALSKRLVPRYWDTPAWPISLRSYVWKTLIEMKVGMLNVDSFDAASRWNWDFCTIMGLPVCK